MLNLSEQPTRPSAQVIQSPNGHKPSDEILKRINSLTRQKSQENEENASNAFDNVVYSYVDNLRQHSKRLSEINLLQTNQNNAIAAASAAAAAAVSSLEAKRLSPTSSPSNQSTDPIELSKSQSINSNLNTMSSLSSSSSSSSSGSSSLSASISSKSINSAETVIMHSSNSNVMSLRDRFEQFKQNGESTSNLDTGNHKVVTVKSKQNSLPTINQIILAKKQPDLNNQVKSTSVNDNLLVNTNISKNVLNSPALSPASTSSSQSHSSALTSSSASFGKQNDILDPILVKPEIEQENEIKPNKIKQSRIFFNFYYEFYKLNLTPDELEDQESRVHFEQIQLKQLRIYSPYEKCLKMFIGKYYTNNVFIQNVFDPILSDSSNSLFNYKFTIEFFKPILLNKLNLMSTCSENVQIDLFDNLDMQVKDDFEQTDLALDSNNLNLYNLLLNEISFNLNAKSNVLDGSIIDREDFDSIKSKLKYFFVSKLNFFNQELKSVTKSIELNDKTGSKVSSI